jgi:hypothetical protein
MPWEGCYASNVRLTWRPVAVVMSIAVLSATVAGYEVHVDAADRVAGCTPPPNENRLLDTYERDPVLRVADNRVDSDPRGGIRDRYKACWWIKRELAESTITSVSVMYFPSHKYDAAALKAAFDQVATGGGWIRVTRKPDLFLDGYGKRWTDEPSLLYCARPLGTLSYLEIAGSQPKGTGFGLVWVEIRVAQPPGNPPCP